jgi:hypothetical protein
VWGEVAHAGKNAVKGDGCMQAQASTSAQRSSATAAHEQGATEAAEIAVGI